MAASVWTEKLPSGKIRVCWRNIAKQTPDGTPVKARDALTATDLATARKLEVRVRSAIDLHHHYVHEAPPEIQIADFERVAAEYVTFKSANGASRGTAMVYLSGFTRICRTIRRLHSLRDGAPIPVTLLGVQLCTRLKDTWRSEVGEQRVYDLSLYLLNAWRWGASQPAQFAGIPVPPLDPSLVLPVAPVRMAAPEPTVAELDAVCRRAAQSPISDLKDIVATMRLTGLRVGQVLSMRAHDMNLAQRVMIVATGKSRREKAALREMPLHGDLVNILRARVESREPAALLFPPAWGHGLRHAPAAEVTELWKAATAAGEAREWVWKPRNRGKARPDHAFRAGFLGALRSAHVVAEVRHALVGHAAESTEARHYSGVSDAELRAGIDLLPGIDWVGPVDSGNVERLHTATAGG